MALGIPNIQVAHETPAIRARRVILGIGLGRTSEEFLATTTTTKQVGVFNGMAGLVPEDPHAPVPGAAFHFQHLTRFQFCQPGMRKIKRHGNSRHTIRREPFVRDPEVWPEGEPARLQLTSELCHGLLIEGPFEAQVQIAHAQIEELFVGPLRPNRNRIGRAEPLSAMILCPPHRSATKKPRSAPFCSVSTIAAHGNYAGRSPSTNDATLRENPQAVSDANRPVLCGHRGCRLRITGRAHD